MCNLKSIAIVISIVFFTLSSAFAEMMSNGYQEGLHQESKGLFVLKISENEDFSKLLWDAVNNINGSFDVTVRAEFGGETNSGDTGIRFNCSFLGPQEVLNTRVFNYYLYECEVLHFHPKVAKVLTTLKKGQIFKIFVGLGKL
jgi:hypothetical protein